MTIEGQHMAERTVVIASAIGLHARPASLFCQAAAATGIPITLMSQDGRRVNAASILGVLSLGIDHGDAVHLSAEGEGADAAVDSLVELLSSDLDAQ